jgi:hypothetical protein
MTQNKKLFFTIWIVFNLSISFMCAVVYVAAQQVLRMGADEPVVRLAIDTVWKMENGETAEEAVGSDIVDISVSLSPFVMVFDANKTLIAASGRMNGALLLYPKGVLGYVDKHGEDRISWLGINGVRYNSVALKAGIGYVVAARSLREVETLIGLIGTLILLAWALYIVVSIPAYYFIKKYLGIDH